MRIMRRIIRIIFLVVFILGLIVGALNLFTGVILSILPASFANYVNEINAFTSAYITYIYLGLIALLVYYFLRLVFRIFNKEMVDIYDPKTRMPKLEHEKVEKVLYTRVEKAEFAIEPKSKIIVKSAEPTKEEVVLKEIEKPTLSQPEVKELKTQIKIEEDVREKPVVQEKVVVEKKRKTKVVPENKTTEPVVVTPVVEEPVVTSVPEQPVPTVTVKEVIVETPIVEPVVSTPKPTEVVVTPVVSVPAVETRVVTPEVSVVKKLVGLKDFKTVDFEVFPGLTVKIAKGWEKLFNQEKEKPYYKELMDFVKTEYENKKVYPNKEDIFKCFELTDPQNVRAMIIGKIPFYRKDQADGLAFSTKLGIEPNPTSAIIIKEAIEDVGIKGVEHGSLAAWAKQGVLLLNSIMTAPSDRPASHSDCGWLTFTGAIIDYINHDDHPNAIVLWGEHGSSFETMFTCEKCIVLKAPNPSPLSAANGFYGSKPFSKINAFLMDKGYQAIDWTL